MADSFVQLPDDSGNTGKKVRTFERTVGANDVHEHYMIVTNEGSDLSLEVMQEDDAHTTADTGIQILAVRTDSPANRSGADGDYEPLQVSAGRLWVSAVVTDSVPGTGASSLGKAEDAAHSSGDVGVEMLAVRRDTPAVGSGTDGDYSTLNVNSSGHLYVKHTDAIPVTQSGTWDEVGINDSGNSITVDNAALSVVGGGVEATALRVTLASDSTGVVSVDDNGGALTVDGTVAVSSITTAVVPGTGASNLGKAEDAAHSSSDVGVMALGVRNDAGTTLAGTDGDYIPLSIDANGALRVTGGGGGTEYTEDAAAAGNPVGGAVILVRQDTPAGITSADGDNIAQRGTDFGAAFVQVLNSSGSFVDTFGGGTQYTEDAAAAADPVGTALIMVRDDALSGQTSADGDNIAARGTDKGELYVKHVDAIPVTQSGTWDEVGIHDSGNSITVDNAALSVVGGGVEAAALRVTIANDSTGVLSVDDNGGSLTVDGTVAVTGVSTLAEQQTQTTHLATIAGDTTSIQAAVEIMDDWDNAASDGASVSGDVAHDAADAGEPVKVGAVAIAHGTNPSAVAAADRTNLYANRAGIPFVIGGHPNSRCAVYNTSAAQTDDPVIAVISSGTKIVITRLTITLDEATTVGVGVRLGFGTANVPALGSAGADGVEGIIVYHPGMVPGSILQIGDGSGIIAVGGDGEDLRITSEAATTGLLAVSITFYTIES